MAMVRVSVTMRVTHGAGSENTRMDNLSTARPRIATFPAFLAPACLRDLQRGTSHEA
jgi:hypothetical protein